MSRPFQGPLSPSPKLHVTPPTTTLFLKKLLPSCDFTVQNPLMTTQCLLNTAQLSRKTFRFLFNLISIFISKCFPQDSSVRILWFSQDCFLVIPQTCYFLPPSLWWCVLCRVQLFVTPRTVTLQTPLSMEFSKQEYWSGLPFLSPGDLPNLGIEPKSSTLQADFLLSEPLGKPYDKPRQWHHFDIILPTKIHIVKAVVFPVVMYGYEIWTIKKAECWRIDAFKLWCWRRLLRVPCTARRLNQSILKEINPEYSLEGLMLKLKFQ